jgi:hypothetical protein
MKHRSVESYMHLYAKQVLASWLRNRVHVGANFKGLQPICNFVPYQNQTAPMMGVYEEFPVCTTRDLQCNAKYPTIWHELSDTSNFAVKKKHGIPSVKELSDGGYKPSFIFDVAVFERKNELSRLNCVFEICHTHPMDEAKIQYLKTHDIKWFELSAEWIMNQVRSPFSIQQGILRSSGSLDRVEHVPEDSNQHIDHD